MHGTGGGPILPPMEEMESEEGDTLREWRRQYAILLEEKENKEKELLNQIIEEAVEFKNELYRKRILAIDTNKATNREKEKVASIKYGMCCRLNDTGVWDVLKLSGDKRCYNINDIGVWALAQLSPNLRQINLSYCSVSDMGLMTVMGNMKCLQDAKLVHLTRVSVKGFELALRASSDSSEKTQVAQQFQVFAFHRITSNASSSWLQD